MNKLYLILVAILIFITVSLSGLFAPAFPHAKKGDTAAINYECCDTGSGENCRPRFDVPKITYNGKEYRLLKTDIFIEKVAQEEHMDPARGKITFSPDLPTHYVRGYINVTDEKAEKRHPPECSKRDDPDHDWLYGEPVPGDNNPFGCYIIPEDILLYLCRADSGPELCNLNRLDDRKTRFDAWIRVSDNEGVPSRIANCYKPPIDQSQVQEKIVFRPSPGGQPNLQLRTFSFVSSNQIAPWLSPYCKPAIYLYPERKSEINVSVFPQGKMLTTIPPYPKNGWDVVADTDGIIHYQNKEFDYLYYEASLPDQLIQPPSEGFVMDYNNRALFLTDLVTKLGLNEKETKQFVDYWVPILPKSPYYFVGVVSTETLNNLAPLLITPQPKHLIRVTLYFKPLEKNESVPAPLILPVSRDGYTAVEWGGIFKQDKSHPFSCFM